MFGWGFDLLHWFKMFIFIFNNITQQARWIQYIFHSVSLRNVQNKLYCLEEASVMCEEMGCSQLVVVRKTHNSSMLFKVSYIWLSVCPRSGPLSQTAPSPTRRRGTAGRRTWSPWPTLSLRARRRPRPLRRPPGNYALCDLQMTYHGSFCTKWVVQIQS